MPLNRVSFYGKNYATGCPFLIKIMRQGIIIDKKLLPQGIMWKDTFQSSHETMDFGKNFMRQGILFGNFLCDRVQGIERFATHPVTSPVKYPPGTNTLKISVKLTFNASSFVPKVSALIKAGRYF